MVHGLPYQLGKIKTAVAKRVERRPKRAASARMLDAPLAVASAAISAGDPDSFARAFATLTDTCNACHQAERVPFITVAPPDVRTSPVRRARTAASRGAANATS